MAHFHNPNLAGAGGQGGYLINQSLRFNSADSARLSRTPASAGNLRTGTISFWIKRGTLQTGVATQMSLLGCTGNGAFLLRWRYQYDYLEFNQGRSGSVGAWETLSYQRDPSAWMHIVLVNDYTNVTSTDRSRIYINGVRQSLNITSTLGDSDGSWNSANVHYIGYQANYYDGYMAEFHNIDGTALNPSSFGETDTITGAWIPKKYSGSYGTNGFYLKFDPSATNGIGHDHSGNGNHWTATGFSTSGTGTDVMSETPTNNWCTLNPLIISSTTTAPTINNGNLFGTFASNDQYPECGAIFSPMGLKGYFELSDSGTQDFLVGFIKTSSNPSKSNYTNSNAFYYDLDNGRIRQGSTTLISSYTTQSVANDIIGIAFDFTGSNRNVWFSLNGSWGNNGSGTGNPATGANPGLMASNLGTTDEYRFYFGFGLGPQVTFNFGQRSFSYTPPTGFKALNTANLPEPTIKKGGAHFNTVLYTGTAATQSITGVGFQPDLIWTKARNGAYSHNLTDAVRGITNGIASNSTSAEYTIGLTSFDANGFSMGAGNNQINGSTITYAAWNWKANGAGSSNTAGSITSTVSANATAGFSIVTYTGNGTAGATVGHGLGVAPKLIIPKSRTGTAPTNNWHCYHASLGATQGILLNATNAAATDSGYWNNTAPTSSVITLGTYNSYSGQDYVAYCFSEVAGYSRISSYTGNGSTDGPFVFCGHKVAWVCIKRTDAASEWAIYDNRRPGYNPNRAQLRANAADAENTNSVVDIDTVSNGFKIRTSDAAQNASGGTYIFAAFAELPFKYANAR